MKRDNRGNPVPMVQRWNRPHLSCQACRDKKRRCDRTRPCSNCTLRKIPCEYPGQEINEAGTAGPSQVSRFDSGLATDRSELSSNDSDELLFRVRRLEQKLAERNYEAMQSGTIRPDLSDSLTYALSPQVGSTSHYVTPFNYHLLHSEEMNNRGPSMAEIAKNLPPLRQARQLFDHFANVYQPTMGILHIPSTRSRMEKTYQCFLEGEEPEAADVMLIFGIFAGAALLWTPQLLETLKSTREGAGAAFMVYTRLALAILDHPRQLIQASTISLAAIGVMAHILMNTDGFPLKVHLLRHRCFMMSRELQIHRLDTEKCREDRRIKGCDMIDIEVQRRLWWGMVASDWLLSFSGGAQEGAYIFQPKHMNVNFPSNTDDEYITCAGIHREFPMSVPTSMSAFFWRIKTSELCRQVIDALPSVLLDSSENDYDTILELDQRFQKLIEDMPVFFKIDPDSIEQSREICKERPYIAWQRTSIHFSLNTRLCRLHRPYHLEGTMNPKYAYSHMVCIRSAQKVLELRRSMDDIKTDVGLMPGRFWTVMHHVFFAALILAMDVSFNPNAPDVEARKAKVMAGYQMLERSKKESNYLMQGVQKNLQTLMSTLHKQQSQPVSSTFKGDSAGASEPARVQTLPASGLSDSVRVPGTQRTTIQPSSIIEADGDQGSILVNDIGEEGWDQLWSEFVAVAPDLDIPQWSSLLEEVDFNTGLDVF